MDEKKLNRIESMTNTELENIIRENILNDTGDVTEEDLFLPRNEIIAIVYDLVL